MRACVRPPPSPLHDEFPDGLMSQVIGLSTHFSNINMNPINPKHQHDVLRNTEPPGFLVMGGETVGTVRAAREGHLRDVAGRQQGRNALSQWLPLFVASSL